MSDPNPPRESPPTGRALGRLEGRVEALEDRVTRSESSIGARLTSIETKLDAVATTLASGVGGMRVIHWIGGLLLAACGYAASHLWPKS